MVSLSNFLFYLFGVNVAYAATPQLDRFLGKVNTLIVNPLIGLIFAVALVYFLYGVFNFVINPTSEEARTTGKDHMLWGIVGMTVMMGLWGLLSIALKTFDITGVDPQKGEVNLGDYNPTWPPVKP